MPRVFHRRGRSKMDVSNKCVLFSKIFPSCCTYITLENVIAAANSLLLLTVVFE